MCPAEDDDITSHQNEDLVALPHVAREAGVSARVLRYWAEQGLISPTREHGKLRYAPHDLAIARLVKRRLDAGTGIDGVRTLRSSADWEIRAAVAAHDDDHLEELALRTLYARKAFRDLTGHEPEHLLGGPPPPPHGGPRGAGTDAPGEGPAPPPKR
jgi:DNA-binding transcriptional MerR regulator